MTVLALSVFAPAAYGDVGIPFATADFTGTNAGRTYFDTYGPVQAASHDNVVMKVTVTLGTIELDEGDAGAVSWYPVQPVLAGTAPDFATRCESADNVPCGFHVEWYDVADLPTSFSGVIPSDTAVKATLIFPSAIGGTYEADIQLDSGSLIIQHNGCYNTLFGPITVTASGTYSLGQYGAGEPAICVSAPAGVGAAWTIRIVKGPSIISGMTTAGAFEVRPTDPASFAFTLTSPAYVDTWVTDRSGRTVRTIGIHELTAAGTSQHPWNGQDDLGHPLADGTYTVNARVDGDTGSLAAADYDVDGTAPTIDVRTRTVSTAKGAITVHITDPNVSGAYNIDYATITARGVDTRYPYIRFGTIVFRPSRAWIAGKHKNWIVVVAADGAGNVTEVRQSLSYLPPPRPKTTPTGRAPRVGRVDRAWISRLEAGPAALSLPQGATALFASFHFSSLPRGGAITTTWYPPAGSPTRPVAKPRGRVVKAFVKSNVPLALGRWRCVLRVGGVAVGTTTIRIG